jgi:hypothetical protein
MTKYRFDEDFDGFLEDFGEPHDNTPITDEVIEAYRDKLPEQLFTYWRALGACGFHNGLIWMVNPADYQDLLNSWLEGSPFENREDLSVIARNAFGELEVWAKNKKQIMAINPNINIIYYYPESDNQVTPNENESMQRFWGYQDAEFIDSSDENEKPLFARALKKLGQLKSDEMYGFSHRLALGGKETLDNLEIVKLDVYHDLAQQMEPPKIIKI